MAKPMKSRLPALGAALLTLAACAKAPQPPPARLPPPATTAGGGTPVQWRHDDLAGAVFYQVFVRSFSDSDGDGVGDLAGLLGKLDYLNDGDPATTDDLGVNGLWLMPVFQSPSYHGYDVVDYENVDDEYGTHDDLERLCAAAHERGLKVIVDLVMNHTSDHHPWFVASSSSPDSEYRDWYVWRHEDPGWQRPWSGGDRTWHRHGDAFYYGIFWGGMPDLNFRTPAVRREMERIAGLWLGRGVDGYRLDATRHLFASGDGEAQNDQPETHGFLRELAAHVRGVDSTAILVGENWTSTEKIAPYWGSTDEIRGGDELPLNFNFPLADAMVEAVNRGEGAPVVAVWKAMRRHYPRGVLDAPFLRNHDQIRLATELGSDPARLRLAAAILLSQPGTAFLYYGEEVGLANGGPGRRDELKRTPMPWNDTAGGGFTTATPWHPFAPGRESANVAAQTADDGSLLSHYRRWIRLRRGNPALGRGSFEPLSGGPSILASLRQLGATTVLVVHNLSDEPLADDLTPPPGAPSGGDAEPLLVPEGGELRISDTWSVTLPARSSAVWRLGG